ncbi:MAG: hypothetical protein HKO57_16185, partial [Akkermansiaceae bacterium]|nr:hypothetical protein [Akkermansiaceae bacterium]
MKIIATAFVAAFLFAAVALSSGILTTSPQAIACKKCDKHKKDEEEKDEAELIACKKCDKHKKDEEEKDEAELIACKKCDKHKKDEEEKDEA